MDRWITFFKERFPLVTMAILVSGLSLSGIYLYGKEFYLLPFIISFGGILFFFALLRLMDEVKDHEKDLIAHRERPLPRGLIKKVEAQAVIQCSTLILFAYSLMIWVFLQQTAALAYALLIIYLWLMYKEFGIGKWLSGRPILYAVLHQLIGFLVAIFVVTVAHPDQALSSNTWAFGLMIVGAFFCYEICRKLDPHAHPILATYVHFYGFRRAFELAAFTLVFSGMGALALGFGSFLIPVEAVVLFSLCLLFFHYAWYRIPEIAASISLLVHVWAVVINRFM